MRNKKALLVIDVQNALCHGEGATYNALNVIDNINLVASKEIVTKTPCILPWQTSFSSFQNTAFKIYHRRLLSVRCYNAPS